MRSCRESVRSAPSEGFYNHKQLQPYRFFDVQHGHHEFVPGGKSMFNQVPVAVI